MGLLVVRCSALALVVLPPRWFGSHFESVPARVGEQAVMRVARFGFGQDVSNCVERCGEVA
eukprot:3862100-Pleurochrysis_carterae.AAC.1